MDNITDHLEMALAGRGAWLSHLSSPTAHRFMSWNVDRPGAVLQRPASSPTGQAGPTSGVGLPPDLLEKARDRVKLIALLVLGAPGRSRSTCLVRQRFMPPVHHRWIGPLFILLAVLAVQLPIPFSRLLRIP